MFLFCRASDFWYHFIMPCSGSVNYLKSVTAEEKLNVSDGLRKSGTIGRWDCLSTRGEEELS